MLNNLKVLIGLLIVFGGLVFWLYSKQQNIETNQQRFLIPAWQLDETQINAIDQVVLTQGETKLQLNKADGAWQLNNGFYASTDPLFDLIQSLKTAQIIETKTANPEKHALLELADEDLFVSLYQGGVMQQAVHVGKKSNDDLTFVRFAGEDQTYTVEGLKPVSIATDNWLLKTVMDVPAEQIVSVSLMPNTGDGFTVKRNLENGSLEWQDMPEGYQLIANVNLGQLFGGLSRFMIDEAVPAESWPIEIIQVAEVPVQLSASYLLSSGNKVNIDIYQQEDVYFLTIDSNLFPQYEGWVMQIAEYKFKALNRNWIEFIEPIVFEVESFDE